MAGVREETNGENVREDIQAGPEGGLSALSVDELNKRADSLIENISAFRVSIARIELLEAHNRLLRDVLVQAKERGMTRDVRASMAAVLKEINGTSPQT